MKEEEYNVHLQGGWANPCHICGLICVEGYCALYLHVYWVTMLALICNHISQVHPELEEKSQRQFQMYIATMYRTQLVAGTNFFIKVCTYVTIIVTCSMDHESIQDSDFYSTVTICMQGEH